MAKVTTGLYHFNRGLISRLALARVDIKRTAFSAEQMTNWMPRVLGSMMLRPGLGYLGATRSNQKSRVLPFIFSTTDTALVEISDSALRVWTGDALITRGSVASVITNGTFDANLAGWTDSDEAGAVSQWAAGGYMELVGTGPNAAIRDQQVTVAVVDQNKEHALRVVIARGPVTIRVGSALGGDEYITETELGTGNHSLAFTPTGDFYVRFLSRKLRKTLVDAVTVEPAGVMEVGAPWRGTDIRLIRADQSGDVLFVACRGYQQRRIERRGPRSWSEVLYQPEDGPFRPENLGPITIAPSALNGNVTLTASKALFKLTQVGGLVKIRSVGQRVSAAIAAENTFTNTIRVVGVGEARRFAMTVTGVWVATVTLQRSIGVTGNWETVINTTGNYDDTINDGLDNQIIYYRIGIKAGNYTSGTATCTLNYTLGSITGVARITAFTSNLLVDAEVLKDFGGTDASELWAEGTWSDRRGWPTAVGFYEGRLWWAGKNGVWGSISDAFDGFDPDFEGTAGPISRTIGSGPVDDINWILPLQRLILGGPGAEHSIRSSAFDEPLSPTNFNVKEASTQGSAAVPAVRIDARGVFVQRCGTRVYELAFDTQAYDYGAQDLTALVPELGATGILAMGVQRQPDTRVHCVLSNGQVALAVIDRVENVLSWQIVSTDGVVEEVVVLPGTVEDNVYYVVRRQLGATGVSALAVTAGSGYTSRPTLSFSGGGGANAAATVDLVLASIVVAAAGAGYLIGDVLAFVGGTVVTTAVVRVVTVDGGGGVLTAAINDAGDYTALPANAVATTGGTGAGCTITATWGLGHAHIVSSGSAYTSAPTVTVNGGGGVAGAVTATISAASQEARYLEKWALESECRGDTLSKLADSFVVYSGVQTVVTGGFVSSLSVVDGIGYASLPTLNFAGGGGAGAAGTVTLALVEPSSSLVALFGSGYSVGDVLTVVGGTFTRPARLQVRGTYGGGGVNDIAIIDGGSYSVVPAVAFTGYSTVTGGTGSGFLLWPSWGLGDATITNPGTGYTSPPIITLSAVPLSGYQPVAGSITATISVGTTVVAAPATIISGLNHLEGKEVVAWGDGLDLSPSTDGVQTTYTVVGGQITLSQEVSQAVVGLAYTGTWVSSQLAQAINQNTALNQRKRISQLGLLLLDTHAKGLQFGSGLDNLNDLPGVEAGADVSVDRVWTGYAGDMIEFPGEWSVDSRLWLIAQAPRPVTVLGAALAIEEHGKS